MISVTYEDVTPITGIGKILASVITIISVGIVALPAGILASGYSEAIRQRRAQYEKVVEDVIVRWCHHPGTRADSETHSGSAWTGCG